MPIDEDPGFPYRVAYIGVFGSYTTNAPTLGDIKLIVRLEPKEPSLDRHNELCREQVAERAADGRPFRSMIEQLYWPESKVKRLLQDRCAYLVPMEGADLPGGTPAKLTTLFPPLSLSERGSTGVRSGRRYQRKSPRCGQPCATHRCS